MKRVRLEDRPSHFLSSSDGETTGTDGVEVRRTRAEPRVGMGFLNLNSRKDDAGDSSQGQAIADGIPRCKRRVVHVDLDDEQEKIDRIEYLLGKVKDLSTEKASMKKNMESTKKDMESMKKDMECRKKVFNDEIKNSDQKAKAIIISMQAHIEKLVAERDELKQTAEAERNELKQTADAELFPLTSQKDSLQSALDATLRRLVKRKDKWASERDQKLALVKMFTEARRRNWKLESDVIRLEAEAAKGQLPPAYTQFVAEIELKLKFLKEEKNRVDIAQETGERNIDEMKEGRLCQICLESPIDTISFPCLHFQYCFDCLEAHRKRSNTCPSCRTAISTIHRSDSSTE